MDESLKVTLEGLRALIEQGKDPNGVAIYWLAAIEGALDGKREAPKKWLVGKDKVDTLQWATNSNRGWVPGERKVDTSHATYALFDGSRRDYAGLRGIAATGTTWVGYDPSMNTIIVWHG